MAGEGRIVAGVIAESGLSDHQVCELFDVSVSTVAGWRSGEIEPRRSLRDVIVERLGRQDRV